MIQCEFLVLFNIYFSFKLNIVSVYWFYRLNQKIVKYVALIDVLTYKIHSNMKFFFASFIGMFYYHTY